MRSVSYVQRVALEFSGSLFPHAICLGDVDNDTVSACALRRRRAGAGRGGAGPGERRTSGASGACARGGVAAPESFMFGVNGGVSRPNRSRSPVWYSSRKIDD